MSKPPLSIVDQALKHADLGLPVFPLAPMSKVPPKGFKWSEKATTDPETILEWFRETPNANYGIATGTDLFVMDLDGSMSIEWWANHGFEPGAIVTTPSGGKHVYYRCESVDIQTNQGKIYKQEVKPAVYGPREISPGKFEILEPAVYHQVDVRGEGGYVVGPGSMLPNGTYRGELAGIPMAPADLIAILPERQTYSSEQRVMEPVEESSESERRQIASIVNTLQALPEVWHEGAGWHDAVFRSAAWLSRMVNANDYALTEDGAITVLLTHTPTYGAEWGDDKIIEQWISARKLTEGQFADPVVEDETPNLLPYFEVAAFLPDTTSRGGAWSDLLFGQPSSSTDGAHWEYRRQILTEAMRAGLNDQQALTIAWNTNASTRLQSDPGGLAQLWRETQKARVTIDHESAEGFVPPSEVERTQLLHNAPQRATLLTNDEHEQLRGPYGEWWGTRYIDWTASRVTLMNAPYHRLNRWTILAIFFGMVGFVPLKAGPLGLNMFTMIVGQSSTGKSEGKKLMKAVIRAMFPVGDSPDIGGDATVNALVEKLIERDGLTSLFNADEAHGLFKEMASAQWRGALTEKWTDLFEGEVPAILRAGKKDLSGINATTSFTMHLMGTRRLLDVLDAEMWESGFLARYVFAISDDIEAEENDLDVELVEGYSTDAYDAMPKQWAAEFYAAKQALERKGAFPIPMQFKPDALARHNLAMREVRTLLKSWPNHEAAKPIGNRFGNQILKAASLVALSEGTNDVTLRHTLIALEQAEEWLGSALYMLRGTTDSFFARQVDEVERYVAGRPGGQARIEEVYKHFRVPKFDTDKWIDQLVAEGRVGKDFAGGGYVVGLKGAQAA